MAPGMFLISVSILFSPVLYPGYPEAKIMRFKTNDSFPSYIVKGKFLLFIVRLTQLFGKQGYVCILSKL